LNVHRKNGDEVDPTALPQSQDWVLRTAWTFLADDPEARTERVTAAARHPEPVQRATLLADALI
jgi:hypothetical protein